MKLEWIYWVSTGLLAAIYLGGGTQLGANLYCTVGAQQLLNELFRRN